MHTAIVRQSEDSDHHKTMPPPPEGLILVRVNSIQVDAPLLTWEHTYFFDSPNPRTEILEPVDASTQTIVTDTDTRIDPPPAPDGWVYVDRDDPREIVTGKWIQRFHYRPV